MGSADSIPFATRILCNLIPGLPAPHRPCGLTLSKFRRDLILRHSCILQRTQLELEAVMEGILNIRVSCMFPGFRACMLAHPRRLSARTCTSDPFAPQHAELAEQRLAELRIGVSVVIPQNTPHRRPTSCAVSVSITSPDSHRPHRCMTKMLGVFLCHQPPPKTSRP